MKFKKIAPLFAAICFMTQQIPVHAAEITPASFAPAQQRSAEVFADADLNGIQAPSGQETAKTSTDFLADNSALSKTLSSEPAEPLVKTYYDSQGHRIKKEQYDEKGNILKEWWFEQVKVTTPSHNLFEAIFGKIFCWDQKTETQERITKYIEYTYDDDCKLKSYRIAVWNYGNDGSFFKVNRIFDARNCLQNVFTESVNCKGIKYQEEWFDDKGNQLSLKKWNPNTGAFVSHYVVVYMNGKKDHVTWLNENKDVIKRDFYNDRGQLIREICYDPATGDIKSDTAYEYDRFCNLARKICREYNSPSRYTEKCYKYTFGLWILQTAPFSSLNLNLGLGSGFFGLCFALVTPFINVGLNLGIRL